MLIIIVPTLSASGPSWQMDTTPAGSLPSTSENATVPTTSVYMLSVG